jgi:hypothetical protein
MSNGDTEEEDFDKVQEVDTGFRNPLKSSVGDIIDTVIQNSPAALTVRADKAVLGLDHVKLDDPDTWTKQPSVASMPDPAGLEKPEALSMGQDLLNRVGGNRSFNRSDYGLHPDYVDPTKVKAGPGLSGTLSGTMGPGVPAHLGAESKAHQYASAAYESAYHQARMDAAGIVGNLYEDLIAGYEDDVAPIMKQVDALLTEAEEEREGIRELIEKAKSNEINPGQFFANVGEAGKFSAAIAVGAGAMATAFGGGPNAAYQIISRAIDRNVRAQVVNQHHGRALIAHQMNFVNTIRGLAKDRAQYGNYVKLALDAVAQAEVGKVRASLTETGAALAAQDVWARLGAKLVNDDITAITNMQARVTFNYKNLVQLRKGAAILGVGQQMQQAQKATGARRGTGKAPAERGGRPQEAVGLASQAAQRAIEVGGSGDDIANTFIKLTTRGSEPGDPRHRDELIRQLTERAEAAKGTTDEDIYTAQLSEAATKSGKAFANLPPVTIPFGTNESAEMRVIDPKRWEKHWKDGIKQASGALNRVKHLVELDQLLKGASIPVDAPLLRDIGIMDGNVTPSTFFSENEAERSAQISAIRLKLLKRWHNATEEGTRNAMNLPWERNLAEKGSSMGVTMAEYIGDMTRQDPHIRRARIRYQQESGVEDVRTTITNLGLWHEALD